MKKILMLVLSLFLVAAFVGCGGDGGTDDETGGNEDQVEADSALTEAEFLAQGNKICSDGNKAINAAAKELGKGRPTKEEFEGFLPILVESIQGQIDGLDALEPPEELVADMDQLIVDAQAALERIKSDGIKIFQSQTDPFAEVNKAATAIGLDKCAE